MTTEGREELIVTETPMPIEHHFTRIELTELSNHAPTSNQMDKIRRHLSSIYRKFLRNGEVVITVNGAKLEAPSFDILNAPYYKNPKGNSILWKKDINFEAGEYKARGFIAILDKIQNGANGLVLMRRGRVIVEEVMNVIFLRLYLVLQVTSVIKDFLANLNWKDLRLLLIKMDSVMKKIFMLSWKHFERNSEMMDLTFLVRQIIIVSATVSSIVILQRMLRKHSIKKVSPNN